MTNLFNSIKDSLGTKSEPVIVKTIEIEHNGHKRTQFNVRKSRGKNIYRIVLYENGMYSAAV